MKTMKCAYCDRVFEIDYLEIDHIVPQSKGGSDDEENLVKSCPECNRIKSDWDVRCIIGEDSTREERIITIRDYIRKKKHRTIQKSDDKY